MSPKFAWLTFNSFLVACLVGGFVYDIPGLRNVGLFIVWAIFVLSVLMCLPGVREDVIKKEAQKSDAPKGFPQFIRDGVILGIMGFLVWFGAFWTAGAYIVAVVIQKGIKASVQELRNKTVGVSPEINP